MRFSVRASGALLPLVATAALVACGGQSGFSSSFQQGEPPGTAGSDSADASTGASTGATAVSLAPPTGSGGAGATSSGSGDGGSTTIGASCNAVSATASRAPLRLVVMLDRSGSMGQYTDQDDNPVDNTAVRWTPVTTALETFFEDPASDNVEASLQFFPLGDEQAQCSSNTYASPSVDFTSLPAMAGSDPFAEAIGQTMPNGGTPTIEALAGALTYAIDTMNSDATGAKYAVVFVTDGDPCSCAAGQQAGCPGFVGSPSDTAAAQAVANLAAKYASVIPHLRHRRRHRLHQPEPHRRGRRDHQRHRRLHHHQPDADQPRSADRARQDPHQRAVLRLRHPRGPERNDLRYRLGQRAVYT